MKEVLIPVSLFGFIILLAFSIFGMGKYIFTSSPYDNAAEKLYHLIDDVETLKARQQLNQIASNSANLQRLTAFCIKHEVTPPVRISDMTACRQSALKYYSLPTDETKLKETAARPLKDQLYFSKEIKPYLDKVNQE